MFAGCSKPLLPGQADRLCQQFYLLFKGRNPCFLPLKLFIFCAGNRHHFFATGCLFLVISHGPIIPYYTRKVQYFQQFAPIYFILRPSTGRCAFGCSTLSPSMSHRYCCALSCCTSAPFLGHWKLPLSSRLYSSRNPNIALLSGPASCRRTEIIPFGMDPSETAAVPGWLVRLSPAAGPCTHRLCTLGNCIQSRSACSQRLEYCLDHLAVCTRVDLYRCS